METNGTGGGHQHEVFEKRLSPGAFPHRLDIELCICGVRRWVDQNGTPATPWQFIRLNQIQAGMCICRALAIGPRFSQKFFGARMQDHPAAPFDLAANRPGEEPLDPLLYQVLPYRAGIPSRFLPYPTSDGLIGIEVRAIWIGASVR